MKIYVLFCDSNFEEFEIGDYPERKQIEEIKSEKPIRIIAEKAEDLSAYDLDSLTAIYNKLSNSNLSRFRDHAMANSRVFAIIKGLADDPNIESSFDVTEEKPAEKPADKNANRDKPKEEEDDVNKAAKKTTAKKEPAEKTERTRNKLDVNKKIKLLVEINPRRPGTGGHKSFELIKNGMKVSEFIEAGGRRVDLIWDLERKHVKLTD